MTSFADFAALSPPLLQAIDQLGYREPTPIQAAALPVLLAGRDVIAQAKTGSGKTAAFGLALLGRLEPERSCLQGLVLCPTRELADQVSKELRALARFIPNVKILTLCGGIPIGHHLASLSHAPHVVVGTPGRILDLLGKDALAFAELRSVVLDEADRMLDMGFLDAVADILRRAPAARSTWLFSATYPPEIRALSAEFQREPADVAVAEQHDAAVIEQRFHAVASDRRNEALHTLLLREQPAACLVFCNTKAAVMATADFLWKRGIAALVLQGDMEQRERDEALVQFAGGSSRVLVATDVAARGLDIKALPLVIALEPPADAEVHTHRIGRTGRAGERGLAITLVAEDEQPRLERIAARAGAAIACTPLPPRPAGASLPPPAMRTLVIDAGRQDKLRPGDIVGALTGVGGLKATDIGKIDVFTTRAYVAVAREEAGNVLERLRGQKIKGRSFRVRQL